MKLTPEHNCHKTQHLLSQVILQSKKENKIVTQIIDKSLRIEKDTKLVLPQFSFKLSKDCFAKLLLLLQSCSCCCCKIVVVAKLLLLQYLQFYGVQIICFACLMLNCQEAKFLFTELFIRACKFWKMPTKF